MNKIHSRKQRAKWTCCHAHLATAGECLTIFYGGLAMSLLDWLQSWYEGNCDGGWEHLFGVTIETWNNSGWKVKVDLEDTYLEDKNFEKVQYDKIGRAHV